MSVFKIWGKFPDYIKLMIKFLSPIKKNNHVLTLALFKKKYII